MIFYTGSIATTFCIKSTEFADGKKTPCIHVPISMQRLVRVEAEQACAWNEIEHSRQLLGMPVRSRR
jgi:hypothetical protein